MALANSISCQCSPSTNNLEMPNFFMFFKHVLFSVAQVSASLSLCLDYPRLLLVTNRCLSFICSQLRPDLQEAFPSSSAVHAWYQQMYAQDTLCCLDLTRGFENVRLFCILSQILKHFMRGILSWYVHYCITSTQENWACSVF